MEKDRDQYHTTSDPYHLPIQCLDSTYMPLLAFTPGNPSEMNAMTTRPHFM